MANPVLMQETLSKKRLWKDRIWRHGLYYVAKIIERNDEPKIIITSFWRSGSTLLLEFLANLFALRPYFEPLTPREPKMQPIYKRLSHFSFNIERIHLVQKDVSFNISKILLKCRFQS